MLADDVGTALFLILSGKLFADSQEIYILAYTEDKSRLEKENTNGETLQYCRFAAIGNRESL